MSKSLLSKVLRLTTVLAVWTCASPHLQAADEFIMVNGSATTVQRIAMPAEAVLTVQIEDVSRADAKATVLAQTSEPLGARQMPLAFSLKVSRAAIDPRANYALRATISVGSELRFTTTRHHAVLAHDVPTALELVLDAVPPLVSDAIGFALPATFTGLTPCADCDGIVLTLTLRSNGSYHLRRTYIGKSDGPFVELGRWTATPSKQQLALRSGSTQTLLAMTNHSTLRLLDQTGQAIESSTNLDLRRTAELDGLFAP